MVIAMVPLLHWVVIVPWTRIAPAAIAHLAMLQAYLPPLVFVGNVPGWSIVVETLYYALFPLFVARVVPNASRGRLLSTIGVAWALGMAVPALQWIVPMRESLALVVRFWPPFRLHELVIGIAAGKLFLLDRAEGKTRSGSLLALPAAIVIVFATAEHSKPPFLMVHNGLLAPLSAALLFGLAHGGVFARMLSVSPLIVLGEASYALYLMQQPLFYGLRAAHLNVNQPSNRYLFFVLLVIASIAAHRWFELPVRRWIREGTFARRVTAGSPRDVRLLAPIPVLLAALYPFAYPFWNPSPLGPVYGAQWRLGIHESGFFKQEWERLEPFRWTKGLATLTIPVFESVPRRVHFRFESDCPRGNDLRLVANGTTLFDGHLARGPASFVFDLPSLQPGVPLALEIHSSTFTPKREIPNALDGRRLGIRVLGVQVE
jgi:peptidoglycan/LPS O-acetylase OafA/YrhL